MHVYGYELEVPGPLYRLSSDHPTSTWAAHPLGRRWVVRCTGPSEEVARIAPEADRIRGSEPPVATACFLYAPRRGERSVLAEVVGAGASLVPPLVWSDGRLAIRFVVPDGRPPASWHVRHPGARLVMKRAIAPRDVFDLVGGTADWLSALTPRQAEVLLRAVDSGYYEVPRRVPVGPIARRLGIARSTAEEHLRAAESTLVRGVAPLVAARHGTGGALPGEADLEYYARFSAELDLHVQMALRDEEITRIRLSRGPPERGQARDHPYLRRILRHVTTGTDDLNDLPVALEVAPFARRVLEEVRRIPSGTTRTYGEIAIRLGEPRAARAVGNAVAANPVPLVIPCHRVVPASGGVGQYSAEGGPRTKRRLLEREQAARRVLGRRASR